MTYSVKEIFLTLQGEGGQAGRVAVFCRFAGCNLWSGLERDRAAAVCTFCDTDFVGTDGPGGGKFKTSADLAAAIAAAWSGPPENRLVVLTGGEPLLQLDAPLVDALHAAGFSIALETNGTLAAPAGVDPARFEHLAFERFALQPMDGPDRDAATRAAIAYCLAHPRWRLSLQTHKYLGIP